jgi:hypothetical protein
LVLRFRNPIIITLFCNRLLQQRQATGIRGKDKQQVTAGKTKQQVFSDKFDPFFCN